MTICGYLESTGMPVAELARRVGVPRTTLFRWRAEELETGRVQHIDASSILRLVEGTSGAITADDIVHGSDESRAKAARKPRKPRKRKAA